MAREPIPPAPTLNDLAKDPGIAKTMLPMDRQGLVLQMAGVLTALGITMLNHDEEPDRAVDVKEASALLHLSTDYLYDHARELPFFVPAPNGARAVLFSYKRIQQYLETQRQSE